jgi:ABC-type uncharacterized transport system substrate-binding protein
MRRREVITLLGGAAVVWPLAARGQQPAMPVVGILRFNPENVAETFVGPFRQYMKELGWDEGRNVRYRIVWAGGHADRLASLAAELVAHNVNALVGFGNPVIEALRRATTTIPVVGLSDDLVRGGLADSMARPGGNTTGISILGAELDAKRLELLHVFVPRMRRAGMLIDPTTTPSRRQVEAAAKALGIDAAFFNATNPDEIMRAFDGMIAAKVDAVNVLASPIFHAAHAIIIERANRALLPAVYQWPENAAEGGFLAYGPRLLYCYRLMVGLLDKVLRGAKPADIPIEQPTKFEFILNLKTAKALGLDVPPTLLARADEVIE